MGRKLAVNVAVGDVWYGPDYPEAGDPPAGKVGDHAFEGSVESDEHEPPAPVRRAVPHKK